MEIQPDKQNLDQMFGTIVYHIDFYQRDYKWTQEPVKRLLDDVFYQFDEAYAVHAALEPTKQNIAARYPWYYLNTYVTNIVDGRVFVVDGQQRLTTLTLILLKLFSKTKSMPESKTGKWLERKIADFSGNDYEYWMHHARHLHVLQGLMEGKDPATISTASGVTAVNMVENYKAIGAELDARLPTVHRLDTFVHYFLLRLVLINLAVDTRQVPMVFEVINDRGVRLRPYEILKGKLLGQIDKIELDSGNYNLLWETQVALINSFLPDEIDDFFRHWLRAKFADTRKAGQRFDGDGYHREMFKSDMNASLKLDHNGSEVKAFLKGAFRYYTELYAKLWKATRDENTPFLAVYTNGLQDLDAQFTLTLAACTIDDAEEDAKIRAVSEGLDRLFSLLQLQGAWDSNAFANRFHQLSADLREQPARLLPGIFDRHLREMLQERFTAGKDSTFSYSLFKQMSITQLNIRFIRYLFARVELLLAEGMKQQMRHSLTDLVIRRGHVNGFHVEHILANNDDNLALFDDDEERFELERNRLGGVLLLKGADNQSSSNETFKKKLQSYASSLHWNETLRADTYKSKKDFEKFRMEKCLDFKPLDVFGPDELEYRHRLLFDLCCLIWPAPAAIGP